MSKKFLVLGVFVLVILVAGGGAFWWWQGKEDVRELNKDLPEGVRVVKSLAGEYRVINEIDGYEFMVPEEWGGLEEIEYFPERPGSKKYNVAGINILGLKGETRFISVDQYKIKEETVELESFAEELLKESGILIDLVQDSIGDREVLRFDEVFLGVGYIYFIKDGGSVFLIGGVSEKFIREIITNGKW